MKNETFFQIIDSEQKAYWLGFIVADGNLSKNKTVMQINLSRKDKKHLKKLGSELKQPVMDVVWRKGDREYNGCYLAFSSKKCWSHLFYHGIRPAKTYCNQSNIFEKIPNNLKHHFIRGVFDGDGCISYSMLGLKMNCTFDICGEENLMISIQLYIHNKVGISLPKPERRHLLTIITWSGREQCSIIKDWMYSDSNIYLERKKEKFDYIYKDSQKRGRSNFRGVVWYPRSKKWLASISHNKKRINLGYYKKELDAATAYDEAVIKFDKPKYKLNFQREAI